MSHLGHNTTIKGAEVLEIVSNQDSKIVALYD